MQLGLVIPAWGRYAVTHLALAQHAHLAGQLAPRGITVRSVVIANDENLDIAREFGFDTVEMPNDDLGAKFNAGYRHAASAGADVFVHIGSDDWIHPDALNICLEQNLEQFIPDFERGQPVVWSVGPTIIYQRRLMVVDLQRWQGFRCESQGHWGCIPWLLPRAALKRHAYAPIKPGKTRGIDGALAMALGNHVNWIEQEAPAEWLVDWKTDTNITPYAGLRHAIAYEEERRPGSLLAAYYPKHLIDIAREMAR